MAEHSDSGIWWGCPGPDHHSPRADLLRAAPAVGADADHHHRWPGSSVYPGGNASGSGPATDGECSLFSQFTLFHLIKNFMLREQALVSFNSFLSNLDMTENELNIDTIY